MFFSNNNSMCVHAWSKHTINILFFYKIILLTYICALSITMHPTLYNMDASSLYLLTSTTSRCQGGSPHRCLKHSLHNIIRNQSLIHYLTFTPFEVWISTCIDWVRDLNRDLDCLFLRPDHDWEVILGHYHKMHQYGCMYLFEKKKNCLAETIDLHVAL